MGGALGGGGGVAEIRTVSGCLPERKSTVLTAFHKATRMLSTVPSLDSAPTTFLLFHSFLDHAEDICASGLCSHRSMGLSGSSSKFCGYPLAHVFEACAQMSAHRKALPVPPQASLIADGCSFPPTQRSTSLNVYFISLISGCCSSWGDMGTVCSGVSVRRTHHMSISFFLRRVLLFFSIKLKKGKDRGHSTPCPTVFPQAQGTEENNHVRNEDCQPWRVIRVISCSTDSP